MANQTAVRFGYPGTLIREYGHWVVLLREPQATLGSLILCAKCRAALNGRINVSSDDVRHLALPVLRHRISCSFAAEAEGVTTDDIVRRLIESVPERTK